MTKIEIERIGKNHVYLNLGPQHPSTHGVLRVGLVLDGEVVVQAQPDIGYLHRSMEKNAEHMTYIMFIIECDRMDYVSAMSNEMAYVHPVEKMLECEVPLRGQYLRVIMLELQRVASHLLFFGTYGVDIGAITPFIWSFREREKILDLFEAVSGGRLLYHYLRIGGVVSDLPEGWVGACRDFLTEMRGRLDEYNDLLTENPIFKDRLIGTGIIPRDVAIAYGLSGPVLRGSGVDFDIRRDDTYLVYDKLKFEVPVGTRGDCYDRYLVRMKEIVQSLNLVEQCLDVLPPGPIRARVPLRMKPPKGEWYARVEASRGEHGFYLNSNGTSTIYRMKVRSPSFSNLSVLEKILPGMKLADTVAMIGSLDITLGDVDR